MIQYGYFITIAVRQFINESNKALSDCYYEKHSINDNKITNSNIASMATYLFVCAKGLKPLSLDE